MDFRYYVKGPYSIAVSGDENADIPPETFESILKQAGLKQVVGHTDEL